MDAKRTYRTLRITIIALAAMLGTSVAMVRWSGTHDVLGSISAYYFTPAHSVFVASVCGLGILLLVYHGNTTPEEYLLDLAGVLAFVVAFVPTTPDGNSHSPMPSADHPYVGLPNNVLAVIGGGAVGLVAAGAVMLLRQSMPSALPETRSRLDPPVAACAAPLESIAARRPWTSSILPVGATLVIVAVSIRQIVSDEPYQDWVHLTAALSMFGCIVLVALYYAFYAAKKEQGRFAFAYGVIAALMAGFVAFIGARIFTHEGVDLFWAEVCVIVLFAAFWFVQTLDLWERDNKYRTGT